LNFYIIYFKLLIFNYFNINIIKPKNPGEPRNKERKKRGVSIYFIILIINKGNEIILKLLFLL